MNRFRFSNLMLVLGLLFIYAPMVILVIYSFNASQLVTVWGGWSVKWYVGLLDNSQLMGSVMRSLEIACYTAIAAVALGTMAAFVLTRISRFKGRTFFGGLVTAPLVMPEVITGLSLLLLFVAMAQLIGWPQERGIMTIWIAHTTFCAAYVAVVVSARLRELDLSIEEAAMDLGARPADHHPDDRAIAGSRGHDVLRAVAGRPGTRQLRLRARLDDLADGSVLCRAPGCEA
jgi:putrescine transport system permease protein